MLSNLQNLYALMKFGTRPSVNPQKLRSTLHEMFRRGYE